MKDKEHKFTVYIPVEVTVIRDDKYEKNLEEVLNSLTSGAFTSRSGNKVSWGKKECKKSDLIVKDLWQ